MLEPTEQSELLKLARVTIESYLAQGKIPQYYTGRAGLKARAGAFVSLHRGDELRGCIGQIIGDRELYKIVQQSAASAATEDYRFHPIRAEELPELKIEISVLTPLRRVREISEIEVGKHGLYVVYGPCRGLLLPQVATQFNWDRETFLAHTCRKAGLEEQAWKDPATAIQLFEAHVFSEPATPEQLTVDS